MDLTGKQIIGDQLTASGSNTFQAINPNNSELLQPAFIEATHDEIQEAMRQAASSFDALRSKSAEDRAKLLDVIAEEIMQLGDDLLDRTHQETGLPMARLTAERGRTVNQAKLFANVLREGSWVDARIDRADPSRQPMAKPDLRRILQPIGPVVVFGASNFPFAIGVLGSDTVSALGAGCPVVVKGHRAHPGTSEMLSRAVQNAIMKCGFPSGTFSMLQGSGRELGLALVNHPLTEAVAFTGSLQAGRALANAAAARPNPIPVYAEMGSINPVFVLPGAAAARTEQIATGYVQSVTLGTGQFCTNPGILFGVQDEHFSVLGEKVAQAARAAAPATMLSPGIRKSFEEALERFKKVAGVEVLANAEQAADTKKTEAACHILKASGDAFLNHSELREECFGPASILVESDSLEQLERIAEAMEPQLTATIHGTDGDVHRCQSLIRILERKAGRLIFNGFPTGIEVCSAMHHGGAYPAMTHSHFTSIGTASILRFVRPVCYQNWPDDALPVELQNKNQRGIWRLIDNEFTRDNA